jgi:hypothetical protein
MTGAAGAIGKVLLNVSGAASPPPERAAIPFWYRCLFGRLSVRSFDFAPRTIRPKASVHIGAASGMLGSVTVV